ncbi:MAG: hypothetical protein JW895_03175 [Thermoleophilaceae bacterium]|nr:hypothetical protein [Thermoleophilaceae bacterium]
MRRRLATCVLAGIVAALWAPAGASAAQPAPCDPVGEYPGDDAEKSAIARWMGGGAAAAGLPAELPVVAALVESGLVNLHSGDADAVGYFHMRVGIWNTGQYEGFPGKPELQLEWFSDQAAQVRQARLAAGAPDPLSDESRWGGWIADVERPAAQYRGRYQPRLADARELIGPLCMPPGGDPSGGSPGPEAPDASDVRAPKLAVRVTQGQRPLRRRAILLRARCPGEGCVVAARGSLLVGKRAYPLSSKPRRLARNRTGDVTVKLSKALRKKLRSAFERGRPARARLTLRAADLAGNVTTKRMSVRLSD